MNYSVRRATSICLGITSAIGTVVTAVIVGKRTPKALQKIEELKSKGVTKKIDYVKALIPVYWPAVVVGFGTIMSTTVSNVISMRTEASLIATSTMLSQGLKRYKGKVQDILGIDVDRYISSEISKDEFRNSKLEKSNMENGEQLYWEENIGFFKCRPLDLMAAITDLNQRLHTPDPSPEGTFYFTTLGILMKDANAFVYDKTKLEACKNMGWTTDYLCEMYDIKCMWVHPFYTMILDKETGEVLFTKISFFEEPIYLQDSEVSRYFYKSREDYEHNPDANDRFEDVYGMYIDGYKDIIGYPEQNIKSKISAIQELFVNSKIDCDCVEDDGRRFIPSNPSFSPNMKYSTGEDCHYPNSKEMFDSKLPNKNDIPQR